MEENETKTQEDADDEKKIGSPDHREAGDSSELTFELHQAPVAPEQN